MRYYMHHVIPNTSSTALTHGTGHAATNGPSSSFQTPGQAVSSSPHTPQLAISPVYLPFPLPTSTPRELLFPRRSSRANGSRTVKSYCSSSPLLFTVLDIWCRSCSRSWTFNHKGDERCWGKAQTAAGAKRKESNDPYSLASKETSVRGQSSGFPSRFHLITTNRICPNSMHSSVMSAPTPYPPIQACGRSYLFAEFRLKPLLTIFKVLDKYLVTSPTPPQPLPHFLDPQRLVLRGKHPNSSPSNPPTAAGNRNSVIDIALSPGISSAINFMMMECQDRRTSVGSRYLIAASLPSTNRRCGILQTEKGHRKGDAQASQWWPSTHQSR
jgi:hypothetical protein